MDSHEDLQKLIDSIEVNDQLINKETISKNLSDAMTGVLAGRKFPGRTPSADGIESIRSFQKGRAKSEETKKKLSIKGKNAGRVFTEEEKIKRSKSMLGKNTGKRSDEDRYKMAEGKSKYIYLTPKGEMKSRLEVIESFDEYTSSQLDTLIKNGKNGFGRTPK